MVGHLEILLSIRSSTSRPTPLSLSSEVIASLRPPFPPPPPPPPPRLPLLLSYRRVDLQRNLLLRQIHLHGAYLSKDKKGHYVKYRTDIVETMIFGDVVRRVF